MQDVLEKGRTKKATSIESPIILQKKSKMEVHIKIYLQTQA